MVKSSYSTVPLRIIKTDFSWDQSYARHTVICDLIITLQINFRTTLLLSTLSCPIHHLCTVRMNNQCIIMFVSLARTRGLSYCCFPCFRIFCCVFKIFRCWCILLTLVPYSVRGICKRFLWWRICDILCTVLCSYFVLYCVPYCVRTSYCTVLWLIF